MTQNDLQVKKNRAVLVGLWAHRLSVEGERHGGDRGGAGRPAGDGGEASVWGPSSSPGQPRPLAPSSVRARWRRSGSWSGQWMRIWWIFDNSLSPSQQRVLSEELKVAVMDRSALILDIFAQRARTREGAAPGGAGPVQVPAAPAAGNVGPI